MKASAASTPGIFSTAPTRESKRPSGSVGWLRGGYVRSSGAEDGRSHASSSRLPVAATLNSVFRPMFQAN
jgi:hypothetical protein